MFSRLAHVCLNVRNLAISLDFYRKLGFVPRFDFTRTGRAFGAYLEIAPNQYLEMFENPDLLRQVWQNLLSNAAKYTNGKSPSWIRVASSGPWFIVEDNGAGFDPSTADQLFGLFLRLHRQADFPGDGIGLATVRKILERHGGIIQADARPDQGAIFRFRLDPKEDAGSPLQISRAGWSFNDRSRDALVVAKEGRTG